MCLSHEKVKDLEMLPAGRALIEIYSEHGFEEAASVATWTGIGRIDPVIRLQKVPHSCHRFCEAH